MPNQSTLVHNQSTLMHNFMPTSGGQQVQNLHNIYKLFNCPKIKQLLTQNSLTTNTFLHEYIYIYTCIDNIFSLNELIQGRIREGKSTFAFFLHVKKAYDTVWRDGLWYKMWEMGIKGKLWRAVRSLYANNRS